MGALQCMPSKFNEFGAPVVCSDWWWRGRPVVQGRGGGSVGVLRGEQYLGKIAQR